MLTFYITFNEDQAIKISTDKDFDPDQYTYIKTRESNGSTLEYYAHNTVADFYLSILREAV